GPSRRPRRSPASRPRPPQRPRKGRPAHRGCARGCRPQPVKFSVVQAPGRRPRGQGSIRSPRLRREGRYRRGRWPPDHGQERCRRDRVARSRQRRGRHRQAPVGARRLWSSWFPSTWPYDGTGTPGPHLTATHVPQGNIMAGTSCVTCPLRNRSLFTPFTDEELEFMQSFKTGEMTVEPGTTLLLEGSNSPQLLTVLNGMGVRYTAMQNGRRQVINFLFPGDFIGLQAGIFGEMKHSVEATTAMTL